MVELRACPSKIAGVTHNNVAKNYKGPSAKIQLPVTLSTSDWEPAMLLQNGSKMPSPCGVQSEHYGMRCSR